MSTGRFFRLLLYVTGVIMAWSFVISRFGSSAQTMLIYMISVVCFFLFSVLIYFYAYNTSKSDQLYSFNNVVSASFLIKLIMSICTLLLFQKFQKPQGNSYVLHFIIVYLVYTAYEVYFLTKLAKSSE